MKELEKSIRKVKEYQKEITKKAKGKLRGRKTHYLEFLNLKERSFLKELEKSTRKMEESQEEITKKAERKASRMKNALS